MTSLRAARGCRQPARERRCRSVRPTGQRQRRVRPPDDHANSSADRREPHHQGRRPDQHRIAERLLREPLRRLPSRDPRQRQQRHHVYNAIAGSDGAFGPRVAPPGPFLVPIDIQSYPSSDPLVHANTYNGQPTSPPYPGEPGAPTHSLATRSNAAALPDPTGSMIVGHPPRSQPGSPPSTARCHQVAWATTCLRGAFHSIGSRGDDD